MRFRHPASGEVQFPKRRPARCCAWICSSLSPDRAGRRQPTHRGAAREALRARLIERTDTLHARGEVLTTTDTLAEVYRERRYTPRGSTRQPGRTASGRCGIRCARRPPWGLRPIDYHRRALAKLPDAAPVDPAAAADAELLLSDTFLLLARHLERGKLDRVSVEPVWTLPPQDETTRDLLVDAVTGNRIESGLRALGPNHPDYTGLVEVLARLREQRAGGGFTLIEPGPTLRPGDVSDRVPALRRRLEEAGIAAGSSDLDSHHYDAALARAVRIAQAREGLDEDGLAGARTLAALNAPVQSRIDRVLASLERFRWLPMEPDRPRVIVNIAGFRLRLERQGRTVLEMPVIVGRKERQTPVFSSRMTHVVLNPSWEVPPSIALEKVQSCSAPGETGRCRIRGPRQLATGRAPPSRWTASTGGSVRGALPLSIAAATGAGQCARRDEVHAAECLAHLSARFAGARSVRAQPARLQRRLRPPVAPPGPALPGVPGQRLEPRRAGRRDRRRPGTDPDAGTTAGGAAPVLDRLHGCGRPPDVQRGCLRPGRTAAGCPARTASRRGVKRPGPARAAGTEPTDRE
ncbi:MAG: L,D-transpeptidase family protein [Gammaproteobacteria bacterium]|nr:L,D-transpeptidase family protein [Gammaproteobacteria bacterium]